MPRPVLEFWYDFASTYSYLSAMRVEDMARDAGVEVVWSPFLLGPIFKSQGWMSSPFNIYPAKGRYMVRDMQRLAVERGLPFVMPEPFPQNSLSAARLSLAIENQKLRAEFTRKLYRAEFADGDDIADIGLLARVLAKAASELVETLDITALIDASGRDPTKAALRLQTEVAAGYGLFGAPTFRTPDGELFWGDDRLPQALDWARRL